MSCSHPLFLAAVETLLAVGGLIRSLGQFVGYALGMGSRVFGVLIAAAPSGLAADRWVQALILCIRCPSAMLLMGVGVDLICFRLPMEDIGL